MMLNDKCLLVVKPAEPFHQWLSAIIAATEQRGIDVSLENMQNDATCYIMPTLPPNDTATYIAQHTENMFQQELNAWCKVKPIWPELSFPTFIEFCKFDFYYDWMDFSGTADGKEELKNIVLLIKPTDKIKDYLSDLLLNKYKLPADEIEKKLDMNIIKNGSTIVITDVESMDDIEYFLDQHYEEIFTHQLTLWGGIGSEEYWPRDTDLRAFKEWFTIEIHNHTYMMLH